VNGRAQKKTHVAYGRQASAPNPTDGYKLPDAYFAEVFHEVLFQETGEQGTVRLRFARALERRRWPGDSGLKRRQMLLARGH
jgi:hypothetical protein